MRDVIRGKVAAKHLQGFDTLEPRTLLSATELAQLQSLLDEGAISGWPQGGGGEAADTVPQELPGDEGRHFDGNDVVNAGVLERLESQFAISMWVRMTGDGPGQRLLSMGELTDYNTVLTIFRHGEGDRLDSIDLFWVRWRNGQAMAGGRIQEHLPDQGQFLWDGLSSLPIDAYQIVASGRRGGLRVLGGSNVFTVSVNPAGLSEEQRVAFILEHTAMPVYGTGWVNTMGSPEHRDVRAKGYDHTFAMDLGLPDNADRGRFVFPAAPGSVVDIDESLGHVVVRHFLGGIEWFTEYMHLDIDSQLLQSFAENGEVPVSESMLLGSVSNVSPNNLPDHLHFVITTGSVDTGSVQKRTSIEAHDWLLEHSITTEGWGLVDDEINDAAWDNVRKAWVSRSNQNNVWDPFAKDWVVVEE